MFWNIMRMIWVIWVTTVCLHYCSMTHMPVAHANDWGLSETIGVTPVKKAPPPKQVYTNEYVVVAGDTLGSIATRYGTTWEKLWDINRDRIADPNIIHIGQKIRIRGAEIVVPPKPQLTRAQKLEKLTKFMCKVSGIRWDPKEDVERALNLRKQWIFDFESPFMNDLREQCDDMKYWSRIYEIHLLAEAIVDNTKTDEEFYKLVGLVWQETQFINRRGKHNERSFYQFLPATVKWWKGVDNIGLVNVLYEVENDPGKATNLALEMLRKNNWNWNWWNHGINYEYQLNNKIYQFKQEWRK